MDKKGVIHLNDFARDVDHVVAEWSTRGTDFLVQHAKFPFPPLDGSLSSGITDISRFEVGLLETEWKAKVAVRDNLLVHKLCNALEGILGDAFLEERAENYLLASFSPRIQFDELGGEDKNWSTNPSCKCFRMSIVRNRAKSI